jgi:hypothetical protein
MMMRQHQLLRTTIFIFVVLTVTVFSYSSVIVVVDAAPASYSGIENRIVGGNNAAQGEYPYYGTYVNIISQKSTLTLNRIESHLSRSFCLSLSLCFLFGGEKKERERKRERERERTSESNICDSHHV